MTKNEKNILQKIKSHPRGLLAKIDLSMIGEAVEINKLIAEKFIEEVPIIELGHNYIGYRLSEKGHAVFHPEWKKALNFIAGDVRTVIVSAITAIIIVIIENYLRK